MNTRDQFGNYLLLKKLTEDVLGETFRAGRLGRQGVERVTLLRVFNGQGLDGERLAQRIQQRAPLQAALKSPNLAQGIDLGQVRGVPYVAYDYVSGKSLAQLTEQAQRKHSPIPLDHGLLMAERIALGLAVAYETRVGDDRVQHGFLTPHLILVSNEGELRLCGFEASTGLREFANHPVIKQGAGRFLAPEVLAGAAPAKADDVYSLGAILFEVLTGKALPVSSGGVSAGLIDSAVIAADGGNLHPELVNLLKRSLVPREQRIGDAVTWHKTLAKLMFDGQYNPTTFNLAFFMHNLFREEIERETQELEVEKTTSIPASTLSAAAAAPASGAAAPAARPVVPSFGQSGGVREDTAVRQSAEAKADSGSKKSVLIAAGVGALALLGLGGWYLFGRGGGSPQPAAAPAVTAVPAAAPAPAGPTPEEIQAQIQKMVDDKIKSSSTQYEDQLKALQKQLDDARKAQAAAAAPAKPTVSQAPMSALPVSKQEPPPPTDKAEPAATTAAAPAPAEPAPSTPVQPAAPPPSSPPPATRAAGEVRPGDLVTMGAGVVPPKVVRRGNFRYPPLAQRMKKEALVVVKVLVDETGRIADVQNSGASAGFGMDEAAIEYARSCSFSNATKNGVPVKMWLDLKVSFSLGG
jgi:serine/threonine-protein kinase